MYGSAANGLFETDTSDLDLTLVILPPEGCTDIESFLKSLKHEQILEEIFKELKQ